MHLGEFGFKAGMPTSLIAVAVRCMINGLIGIGCIRA